MLSSARVVLFTLGVSLFFTGSAGACFIVGDLNGDCQVGFDDLLVVANQWLAPGICSEQGLVGHWKLDEETGTDAVDSSGNERHGVVFGGALWNPEGGKTGGTLQFDGTDDYVEITDYKGITGSNSRTCAAWIKSASPGGEIVAWGELETPTYRWVIRLNEEGLLRLEVGAGFVIGSTILTDNLWHHVAVVSGGSTNDNVRIYVDGQIDVISSFVSQSINTPGTNDVRIGVFADTQRYFKGLIDDVRIYGRVVSSGEIWALANTGTTDFACVDLNADDRLDATDFARLAEYWNEERPPIIISEFLADNDRVLSTHVEGIEEYPDWIEILNNTTETIDLSGWHLTDRADIPDKWRFPEGITLGSGDYLIVFASRKEQDDYPENYPYVDDDGFLHTNFGLSNEGEYLGLVGPDASTVMHEYNSFELEINEFGYPRQEEDISYGFYYGDHRYFFEPSPGTANRSPFDGLVEEPVVSHPGGCYVNGFDLTITCQTEDAIIRYTTNGTVPNLDNGMTYTGPIHIDSFTHLMVKGIKAGFNRSDAAIHSYIFLDSNVTDFNSNLPIVVIDTDGQAINQSTLKQLYAVVIDTDKAGRVSITDSADFSGWGGIKIRGSSSTQFPKKQYAFEAWDQFKEDKDVSILGMPSESDWILYAPYSDKSLMRNHLSYKWSNDIGQYAVRTRFVEMYLNTNGGKIIASDYVGVYVFMEKIKRDGDRVDIARIDPSDNLEPDVSGGYIVKKDRLDPGDSGFLTSRGQRLAYVEPKEEEITQPQADWLKGYLDDFESALYGGDYRDPVNGYARYIDVNSWIDSHILVELTKNIDGYRLSAFMFKDRGEKFNMGPIWDYNLSLGNANYLQGWLPEGWYYSLVSSSGYPWYPRIFQDPLFKLRYADRWYDLRRNMFSTRRLLADVNYTAAFLGESQKRNFVRWPVLGMYVWPNWYIAQTYQDEIDWMKGWIEDRLTWMDDQIGTQYAAKPPVYSHSSDQAAGPFNLEITSPSGTIYYTLDGSDPRSDTGSVSASTIEYTGSIALDRSRQVKARSLSGGEWSAYNDVIFSIGPVARNLRITEIMYHPADPNTPEAEFIELTNIGDASVNLNLVRFTDGIDFTFGDTWLPAGEYVVVVKDQAAFLSHYEDFTGIIAGEYTGSLDNGGERITLVDATGQKIHNFTYSDGWYDITDGDGFSLVIKEPNRIELDRVEPGPAAHWKLDEYNGLTAYDSSPSGHDGVVNGGAVWRSYGGRINGALDLDGINDHVTITGYKGITGSKPRTCTAWIKTSVVGAIVHWGSSDPGTRWTLLVATGGRLGLAVGSSAVIGSTVITDGKWHHVAVVSDGSNVANIILYVDGDQETPDSQGDMAIDTQPVEDVTIGKYAAGLYFAGLIDNVCVYDRVLSDVEIALLAESDDYWEDKRYWRPSAQMGGSPGEDDPDTTFDPDSIVISEVMTHTDDLVSGDWIEIRNKTGTPVYIGGWFLSDNTDDLMKYEIAANDPRAMIALDSYVVFDFVNDFGNPGYPGSHVQFGLSEHGEDVYLTSGAGGVLTGEYSTEQENFGAAENGVTLGMYIKSDASDDFVRLLTVTKGSANNNDPIIGPVVISEIMYNPQDPDSTAEFIEVANLTSSTVFLYDTANPANTWQIKGVSYVFPPGITLSANEIILITRGDPTIFRSTYGISSSIDIYGPYNGALDNGGEKVTLIKPGAPDPITFEVPEIRIDRVNYSDGSHPAGSDPWPTTPDGGGKSLTRKVLANYGNDLANWQAANPSPGQ